jgi:hypothetical protein
MAMKRYAFLVLASVLFVSCASMVFMGQEDPNYRVVQRIPGNLTVTAKYESPEYRQEQENKRAKLEMRESGIFGNNYGLLAVRVQSPSAIGANTKNWLFVVKDADGNEICRERGLGTVTGYSKSYNVWWSHNSIIFFEVPVFPLRLMAIDILRERTFEIMIFKK